MAEQPISAVKVTDEEVSENAGWMGTKGRYGWKFDEALFDGDWWALEVPANKVGSATNSYRNQCESVYGTRASVRRGRDGRVFVKRLVDEPTKGRPSRLKDDE